MCIEGLARGVKKVRRCENGPQMDHRVLLLASTSYLACGSWPVHMAQGTSDEATGILRIVRLELSQVSGTEAPARSSIVTCALDQRTLDMLESIPEFSAYEAPNTDDAPYCITRSLDPAAGLGMFAQDNLDMGDLILADRPLAAIPAFVLGGSSNSDPEKLLEKLTALIDQHARSAFFALADCHQGPCHALGIFKTNGIGLGDDLVYPDDSSDPTYIGVFNHASRINHR